MHRVMRDMLLSFCPASVRREHRPDSPSGTVRAATWLGLGQFLLFGFLSLARYKHFIGDRLHLWAPHLAGKTNEVFQAGVMVLVTLEYFLYPLSFLLFYLSLEGMARFATGLVASEVLPSLPVSLAFRFLDYRGRKNREELLLSLPPDSMDELRGGRLRIASASPKANWRDSTTISVRGVWYQVERQERGPQPRPFIYVLEPAPVGRVLRGIEEYDPPEPFPSAQKSPIAGEAQGTPKP